MHLASSIIISIDIFTLFDITVIVIIIIFTFLPSLSPYDIYNFASMISINVAIFIVITIVMTNAITTI